MVNFFSKFFLSGSSVFGIVFLNFPSANVVEKNENLKEIKQDISEIKTLEDIELFEKLNNCVFGFVGTWTEKKVWTVREFLKNYTSKEWKGRVIDDAKRGKNMCKEKKQVALAFGKQFHYDANKFK